MSGNLVPLMDGQTLGRSYISRRSYGAMMEWLKRLTSVAAARHFRLLIESR